jgi:hypothetical protein
MPRLCLFFGLLCLGLLFHRQHGEDVGVQACPRDGHVGLYHRQISCAADRTSGSLTGIVFDCDALGLEGRLQPRLEGLGRVPVLHGDVADLLALRSSQVELSEREPGRETAAVAPAASGCAGATSAWRCATRAAVAPPSTRATASATRATLCIRVLVLVSISGGVR